LFRFWSPLSSGNGNCCSHGTRPGDIQPSRCSSRANPEGESMSPAECCHRSSRTHCG
jgi:hypothetical protein